jgi:uncharacterized membrane protein YedE/YeeE
MGASGIISSVALAPRKALTDYSQSWKLMFLGSFVSVANLFFASRYTDARLGVDPRIPVLSNVGYSLAGLLVGIGTKLGNGCTSGHGICGLGRMSRRSFVAVLTFMSTSIATTMLTSPISMFAQYTTFLRSEHASQNHDGLGAAVTLMITIAALAPRAIKSLLKQRSNEKLNTDDSKLLAAIVSGSMFAMGLSLSGMVLPSKVYGFLNLSGIPDGSFDPTLAMVMLGGVIVSWLSYQFVEGHACLKNCTTTLQKPLAWSCFLIPTKQTVDWPLVAGAAIFGVGWGLGGLCPGPAIFQAAVGVDKVIVFWWPAFFAGAFCGQQLMK